MTALLGRCRYQTAKTGTGGPVTLDTLVPGFFSVAQANAVNGADYVYYLIDGNNCEECHGTINTGASPPTITRTTRTALSAGVQSTSPITLSGSATVVFTPGPEDLITPALLQSYLAGLQLSNDVSTPNTVLDVAAGVCVDSTNSVIIQLSALTKSVSSAWAAGSGNGGMGNGLTVAANTWYHAFAIIKAGTADVYFDTSVGAANAPSGTTAFRRLGSFKTDGSSHILAFSQNGDEFLWSTAAGDINTSSLGTTAALFTLSVPTGMKVNALVTGSCSAQLLINSPDAIAQVQNAPVGNQFNAGSGGNFIAIVRVNTSGQIRAVGGTSGETLQLATYGWIDRRGRDN